MPMKHAKYEKHYSEDRFWSKLKKYSLKAGMKVVYAGLLLFYAVQSPKTPLKAKIQIYGALGYLILPLDAIPDFLPFAGYVDDFGALMLAVRAAAGSIDDEVKQKAKDKLKDFFGETARSGSELTEVDAQISE